jgi:NADH-ubiquinone oxidoreductase chain 5
MSKRIFGLLVFAILGGSILNWIIFPFSFIICIRVFYKFSILITCFLGGLMGFFLSNLKNFSLNKSLNFYLFSFFSCSIWFIPLISTVGVTYFPINLSFNLFKIIDQGWVEFFGTQQIFKYFSKLSSFFQILQFNNLKIHLVLFSFWLIFIISLLFII